MSAARHRVLIVVQNIPLHLDRRVRAECQALVGAGYGVTVICPKGHAEEPDKRELDGVVVRSYKTPPTTAGLISYIREFVVCWLRTARLSVRAARAEGFDVIQACNPPDTYWLLARLWKLRGKRFVYDQHDLCPEVYEARFGKRGVLHRALRSLERATYRTADFVISPNPSYREVALGRGKVDEQNCVVVMSTPDPQVMRAGQPHAELRQGRRFLVCYVGIMGPQDGVDRLLQAADHYVHQLGRTDCHFALLGYGDSLEDLKRLRDRLDLAEWVDFVGKVDHAELGKWLSTADLGVTPDPPCEFNNRSTMNKTLEYMAHKVPVVATDLQETVRCASEAGAYVPDGDPVLMAKYIADLLDDPHQRHKMGEFGRRRIETDLAWSKQARRYVGVFDVLTGRTDSGSAAMGNGGDIQHD